jgi:hypothetical protein
MPVVFTRAPAGARTFADRPLAAHQWTGVHVIKSGHAENLMQEIEDCSMRDGGHNSSAGNFQHSTGKGQPDKGGGEYRGVGDRIIAQARTHMTKALTWRELTWREAYNLES